ncbi:hypothetical protein ACFOGJ_01905 [Marinibaculum pumilum]|uniref:HEAT repeat domain-containing protein n=1 Tax=Marinibaculum pumilum TaxID=1766165 RepID=A0ABV7KUA4_9PROT
MAAVGDDGDRVAAAAPYLQELLQDEAAATALVGLTWQAAEAGDEESDAALLLEGLLTEIRMLLELQQMGGACRRFQAAARAELARRIERRSPAVAVRHAFGRIHVRAGLPVPEELRSAGPVTAEAPDLDPELALAQLDQDFDSMAEAAAEEPLEAHQSLVEILRSMPTGAQEHVLRRLLSQRHHAVQRLALYWLLDPDSEIREVAAEALHAHARQGTLDPSLPPLLGLMAAWLPPEPAPATIEAVRKADLRQAAPKPRQSRDLRVYASLPDGSGTQTFAATARHGRRRVVAMVLLKAVQGVGDAYVLPCTSAGGQQRIVRSLRQEVGILAVPPDCLKREVAAALAEGLGHGRPPAPGLLDVAEACGLTELIPTSTTAPDRLARLRGGAADPVPEPEALIRDSDIWADTFPLTGTWFEMLPDLGDEPELLSPAAAEERIRQRLEERRPFWAMQMLKAAEVLQSATDRNLPESGWAGFAAVAEALLAGRPLAGIPALETMVDRSLLARAELASPGGEEEADGVSFTVDWERPAAPGELEEMLGGLEPPRSVAYLDGRIVALLTAPLALTAAQLLQGIVGQDAVPPVAGNDERLGRQIGLLAQQLEAVDTRLFEAAGSSGDPLGLSGFDTAELKDWSAGFVAVTEGDLAGWTQRRLRPDDRKFLALIRQSASGRQPETAELRLVARWLHLRRTAQR